MSSETKINHFKDLSEYLRPVPNMPMPKKKCKRDIIFNTFFFINSFASIISCILLCFLCISGLVLYKDVALILGDAKGTLTDLNVILPEVHDTMIMLQHLCNTPEFNYYCFPNNSTKSIQM